MHFNFRFNPRVGALSATALVLPTALLWATASGAPAPAKSQTKSGPDLEQQFTRTVRPFLQTYCVSCHGKEKPSAQLDLTAYTGVASVARDYPHWSLLMDKLAAKQMPPAAAKQPSVAQREAIITWVKEVRQQDALRNAGDPGPVLARRLSNAEYDYTIRDLTGVDLHPTREFPVDPANQEGFDNSGESLTFSSTLMKKYVGAAKEIADRLVLTSNGLEFASHPVLAETDRDKFCVLRIVDFYKKQPTDLADYFQVAWKYKHRAALGTPSATLESAAVGAKISPRYLEQVWSTLTAPGEKVGPIAKLQSLWNALPAPQSEHSDAPRGGCEAMRDWVQALRGKVACRFVNIRVPQGFSPGGQCFVLWKDRQYATHRRLLDPSALQIGGVPQPRQAEFRRRRGRMQQDPTPAAPVDPELFVPKEEAARAPYIASFNRFCSVFPDSFYIAERGRMFEDGSGDKGRFLSAGFHNQMGYFRDDTPLMELVLDDKGRQELDRLWQDFDQVAFVPERMHQEFIFYERAESATITGPEFNFARSEDKDITSDAKIKRLEDVYLAKAKKGVDAGSGEPLTLQAIEEYFRRVSVNIRAIEKARLAAELGHIKGLLGFARRAYRRPLTSQEQTDLLSFYKTLRQKDGLTHEDAIRDTVASVLMSPNFLFRMDLEPAASTSSFSTSAGPSFVRRGDAGSGGFPLLKKGRVRVGLVRSPRPVSLVSAKQSAAPQGKPNGSGLEPLPDYALASRLSYFLWSTMPDEELLAHAAAGDLHRPEVLTAQAHRMLRDSRVRALALEFGGNWLDFRRFEEHNAVDRNRFPTFTDDLRQAMFEEPVRFLVDEFQSNLSVLDMVYGKYTFVNAVLAKHYGMTAVKPAGKEWVRVENADLNGRGGLLPMAAFLTKNAPGLRTSPVKRGYWVVRRLLGEVIPPPPAIVPELPKDEKEMGDLTLRQALEQHRKNPACAGCHARFDSYGLVFEGYGPIGELRSKDLGGKPVDMRAPFPGGKDRSGVVGLRDFIREQRQNDFLDTLNRKMLSYSLGRSLQPSDDPTLLLMRQKLAAGGYRFGTIVETIVTSRQFRNRRAYAALARD
jgi:mono/diheme cytochrome c family protein